MKNTLSAVNTAATTIIAIVVFGKEERVTSFVIWSDIWRNDRVSEVLYVSLTESSPNAKESGRNVRANELLSYFARFQDRMRMRDEGRE